MANYSDIFPLGSIGNNAVNTLVLIRPVDGKIIDLVTGYETTKIYHVSATASSNGKITIDAVTSKFDKSIKIESAILNTLSTHFYDTDFTIECFQKPLNGLYNNYNHLFGRGDTLGSTALASLGAGYSSTTLAVGVGDGTNSYSYLSGTTPSFIDINNFNHFAIVRYNNVITFYVGGIARGSTPTLPALIDVSTPGLANVMSPGLAIGGVWYSVANKLLPTRCASGWYEEIRVSNIARYTADFTPPTQPFVID